MNNFTIMKKFIRRLKRIGIEVELAANYPWIYLTTINGNVVKEKYMAEHGFTAFWFPVNLTDNTKFTDRRKVFSKIRETLEFSKCT